jgi:hypothetical protein
LMHCSGQTHQCQPGKAEVNLSTALKHWLLRYQAQDEAMDQRRHRLMNHLVVDERNN